MANDPVQGSSGNRNRGIPFDQSWVRNTQVDARAIEQAAESLASRIAVTKESQPSLLHAISVMDLTTLADDDTDERVRRLCARGRQPLPPELSARLGLADRALQVAAVCIYHPFIKTALHELHSTRIKVATVSADFPKGLAPMEERIAQIHRSVEAGADEIDVVIQREHASRGDWQTLYEEVAAFRAACGDRLMKVILGYWRIAQSRQHRPRQPRGHDGRRRLHQDFHRQGIRERHPARRPGDDASDSRVRGKDRHCRRIQTRRRHPHRQAGPRILVCRERGTGGDNGSRRALFRIGASSVLDDIKRHLQSLVN